MLVVAVISAGAYPFWLSQTQPVTLRKCFLVTLCHLIIRRLNLEVATKRLLYQQVKILGQF